MLRMQQPKDGHHHRWHTWHLAKHRHNRRDSHNAHRFQDSRKWWFPIWSRSWCRNLFSSLFLAVRWLAFADSRKNHLDRQLVHDHNPVITFNLRCHNRKCFAQLDVHSANFPVLSVIQRNQYLFLPWIILGIMLCIGLLVDVIYTAVVFFMDDHTTAGILWIVFGLICVGEFWVFHFVKPNISKLLCFAVVFFYMWAVVLSHFLQLKEQNDRGKYSRTPYRR